jgi:hypothetical protein
MRCPEQGAAGLDRIGIFWSLQARRTVGPRMIAKPLIVLYCYMVCIRAWHNVFLLQSTNAGAHCRANFISSRYFVISQNITTKLKKKKKKKKKPAEKRAALQGRMAPARHADELQRPQDGVQVRRKVLPAEQRVPHVALHAPGRSGPRVAAAARRGSSGPAAGPRRTHAAGAPRAGKAGLPLRRPMKKVIRLVIFVSELGDAQRWRFFLT